MTYSNPHGAPGESGPIKHQSEKSANAPIQRARSVLAWPAWLRVAAVLPVVLALWLAVWWANEGAAPW